ncbi:MAG TPA: ERAP1-like C-terminal domain-containing protein, partial [Spirochaetia bacterium]|nr:ERAP1-like C-terminal domain-containing protein [Spirochaetia bacterium]
DSVDWVVGNVEANGFYRVSYGAELLAGLSARLFDRMTPIERFAMLDDRWASLLSGDATAESFFELANSFSSEESVDVWHTLSACLAHLSRLVEGEALTKLRAVVCGVAENAFVKIGWEATGTEAQEVKELRGVLVETLCITGADPDAMGRARVIHEQSFADPSSVEPNMAAAALGAVASVGTALDHQRFAQRAAVASSPQEKLRYLYALSSFPEAAEIDRTLALTLSGEVRTQNAPYLIGSCLRNRYHGNRAWKFIRENWDKINSTFPPNTIVRMLAGVRAVDQPETAAEIESFFSTHAVPQGKLMLEQHLELMRVNVALKKRESGRFAEYLLRNQADRS